MSNKVKLLWIKLLYWSRQAEIKAQSLTFYLTAFKNVSPPEASLKRTKMTKKVTIFDTSLENLTVSAGNVLTN